MNPMRRGGGGPGLRRAGLLLAVALTLALLAPSAVAVMARRALLRPSYARDGLVTFLVVGSDLGPPHRPGNPLRGRADAIHLLAVDPRSKRATLVGIPRDGWVANEKVTKHLMLGGPERLEAVLEGYTGVPIDFWVLTSFSGLEGLVNSLGGIDVVVEQRMLDAFSGSDFHPGPQRLSGAQALAFTRDRHSVRGGDIGRSRHQGNLLRYAHIQVRNHLGDVSSLVRLTASFARHTVSNIPPSELLLLAVLATEIDPAHVLQVPLGGRPGMVGPAAVIHLTPGNAFERIRAGQVGP